MLLKKIKDHPTALSYLPDDPQSHVTKPYLYTIVNTLDCHFFTEAEKEIEAKIPKKATRPPVQITVDKSMMDLIEQFASMRVSSKRNTIAGINSKRSKRTRAQVTREWDLITKVRETVERQDAQRSRLGFAHSTGKRFL